MDGKEGGWDGRGGGFSQEKNYPTTYLVIFNSVFWEYFSIDLILTHIERAND